MTILVLLFLLILTARFNCSSHDLTESDWNEIMNNIVLMDSDNFECYDNADQSFSSIEKNQEVYSHLLTRFNQESGDYFANTINWDMLDTQKSTCIGYPFRPISTRKCLSSR